jgi:hypothetical protein
MAKGGWRAVASGDRVAQFLIVFNHERGALHQDVSIFVDPVEALRAYDAAERHFAEHAHIEVVLIGSLAGHRTPHPRQLLRRHHRPGTPPTGRRNTTSTEPSGSRAGPTHRSRRADIERPGPERRSSAASSSISRRHSHAARWSMSKPACMSRWLSFVPVRRQHLRQRQRPSTGRNHRCTAASNLAWSARHR